MSDHEFRNIFEDMSWAKVAKKKMKSDNPDFMIYSCGWVGDYETTDTMLVCGAVFREALSGPRKGKKCIKVPGTRKSAYVTEAEMEAFEKAEASV